MSISTVLLLIAVAQIYVQGVSTNVSSTTSATCQIDFYNARIKIPEKNFSAKEFLDHACSACYINMPDFAFKNKEHDFKYDPDTGLLYDFNKTYSSGESYANITSVIYKTFEENYVSFWVKCCQSAQNCWNLVTETNATHSKCPPVWDGLRCWQENKETVQECPEFYTGFMRQQPSKCSRNIKKKCQDNGHWLKTDVKCEPYEFYRYESPDDPNAKQCCMTNLGIEMSYKAFQRHSCAGCYSFMTKEWTVLVYDQQTALLINITDQSKKYYADLKTESGDIIESTLPHRKAIWHWKTCCMKAKDCCDEMLHRNHSEDEKNYCPQIWDGWSCYNSAKIGTTAKEECPEHVYFESPKPNCLRHSEKICYKNGIWQKTTEYSTCNNDENEIVQQTYLMSCYAVSFIFLVVALILFFSFRQLQVHRITIHKNLFIAMALLCFFLILEKKIVMLGNLTESNKVLKNNGAGCKILSILSKYTVMASHFWMLCEGIYLHQVITSAFKEQKKLWIFYLIGWGTPVLPTIIYVIMMVVSNEQNCWTTVKDANVWILSVPSFLCLLLNLFFLGNIVRVLVTKLRSIQSNEPTYFRKALRAALFLIPLLGLHQFIPMINYNFSSSTCASRRSYILFQHTIHGMEGVLVSFLFCFLNGEVMYLLKMSFQKFKANHDLPSIRSRLSFSTQVSVVPVESKRVAETQH